MAQLNAGDDWVEGTPKWWWKYVFPNRETLWLAVLTKVEPDPVPWLQRVTGEVLEGLVMLHAAARADQAMAERLRSEAIVKINQALAGIRMAEGVRR